MDGCVMGVEGYNWDGRRPLHSTRSFGKLMTRLVSRSRLIERPNADLHRKLTLMRSISVQSISLSNKLHVSIHFDIGAQT